jgi:Ni,Fe-hydrogenase I large subunit
MQREGTSIMTRLLARLLEVSELLLRLRDDRVAPSWLECTSVRPGTGVAWVQTARGLLIHWLRLEDGLIADYRIVAPTEWNFHPTGAFAHGLVGRIAHSEQAARSDAERLLIALDPCVAYTLELNHA